jgi:hypothetical protein
MAAATPPPTPEQAKPTPRTTLQLLILYPTVLLALGGSLPTVIRELKAWRLGVQSSQLDLALEQARLWERNLECIQEQGTWEIDGPHGIVVRATLCSHTGDVLLRYHLNEWPSIYKWVSLPVEKVPKQ